MHYLLLATLLTSSLLSSCQSKKKKENNFSSLFDYGKAVGVLDNRKINEASGLDASVRNENKFWTHNDSGGTPELFLINNKGEYIASAILKGLKNRDWEDITVGPGPDSTKSYVYVGEIGDNESVHSYKYIYRFEEPILEKDKSVIIQSFDTIAFQFDNGQRDSEALLIDQRTSDLYIFSKREEQVKLYRLSYPQRTDTFAVATTILSLPISQVVAADYNNASGELILKNYDSIYYWKKKSSESFSEMLNRNAIMLAYKREPQGEAICFSAQGDGYYTLSEAAKTKDPNSYFTNEIKNEKHNNSFVNDFIINKLHKKTEKVLATDSLQIIKPALATERVKHDSDDPAIWIDPTDSTHVIIVGTDKGGDTGDGGLFAFDLSGKIIDSVRPLKRPNNVDIAYGLQLNGKSVDIAVCTERLAKSIRVFSLPDLNAIDNGGIPVFGNEADSLRDPMGVALYTNPVDKKIYAIVGRKTGPTDGSYLWQYLLEDDGKGNVKASLKRKFGFYSGKKEIESIAVDNELGYIYHSDEMHGIHKSYAHPDSSNVELALFGTSGFLDDIEGISIYKFDDGTGYLSVSDQQASKFRYFPREGNNGNTHAHPELKFVNLQIVESDGSDVTCRNLPGFPHGLFVAMTDDGTFQFYKWEDLAGDELKMK